MFLFSQHGIDSTVKDENDGSVFFDDVKNITNIEYDASQVGL